jgi:subtilisin family serine protease
VAGAPLTCEEIEGSTMTDGRLSDGFRAAVAKAGGDEIITALLRTGRAEPDGKALDRLRAAAGAEHLAAGRSDLLRLCAERYGRGEAYRANLRNEARERQARLLDAAPEACGLWLADAVAVSGTPAELLDLARHDDVVRVEANPVFAVPGHRQTPAEDGPAPVRGAAWGVARIGAPDVWGGFGRGDGVLVGHLDTGVDDGHPALAGKVSAFQEFDALGLPVVATPHDSDAHGTHTAGTIAGRTVRGVNIGVAPGARLASALVLPGGSGTYAQIVAGMQWAIEQGAHVLALSVASPGRDPRWRLPVLNAVLAGVPVVAPVGNGGHGASDGPGNDPLAIGVGATGPDDVVAAFSGGQARRAYACCRPSPAAASPRSTAPPPPRPTSRARSRSCSPRRPPCAATRSPPAPSCSARSASAARPARTSGTASAASTRTPRPCRRRPSAERAARPVRRAMEPLAMGGLLAGRGGGGGVALGLLERFGLAEAGAAGSGITRAACGAASTRPPGWSSPLARGSPFAHRPGAGSG